MKINPTQEYTVIIIRMVDMNRSNITYSFAESVTRGGIVISKFISYTPLTIILITEFFYEKHWTSKIMKLASFDAELTLKRKYVVDAMFRYGDHPLIQNHHG